MPMKRRRSHIHIPADQSRTEEPYRPHPGRGDGKNPGRPEIGRAAHGRGLTASIEKASTHAERRRREAGFEVSGAKPGIYLEIHSFPGFDLKTASLESKRAKDPHQHIELVAVSKRTSRQESGSSVTTQHATVFVPEGKTRHFLNQLEKYALETPKKPREIRHEDVYDRIAEIRLATLRALWTDSFEAFPENEETRIWWEIWLRRTDGDELARFHEYAELVHIRLGNRRIQFDDRIVILAYASARQLSMSVDVLSDLAELRRAKEAATFFVDQSPREQAEWVDELAGRTRHADENSPAVCLLDTGVNRGHPLIESSLPASDCHAVDVEWGTHDHEGHGTEMAGLALYGDLTPALATQEPIHLRHGLESVKILPPRGSNDPDLYGALTAEAVSRPEISAPLRRRTFSMAVTAPDSRDRGQPTSWSSAIDALAAGRSFDASSKGLIYLDDDLPHRRLFVLSAGNVDGASLETEHLDRSDTEPVHDPAQAWNALTVGASTEKAMVTDAQWNGWSPVASPGQLSPWSTTSVTFANQWPNKPDIVMEGGNVVQNAAGETDYPCDDLCLLTTHYRPNEKLLVSTLATSPAATQVARMAGSISAVYPDLWPETVRGLLVHSAEWTPAMKTCFDQNDGKTARARLLRRYGFGVPSLERALRSAENAVTLLVQDSIRPFSDGKMQEIHFHDLPWPRDVLASLGEISVRLRVTLSEEIDTDIWTPIANQVGIPITIESE